MVTGGSSGIGLGVVELLSVYGAKVAMVDVSPKGAEKAQELKNAGREVEFFQYDVANEAMAESTVKDIAGLWGKIDILHNNAGVTVRKTIKDLSEKEWDFVLDVGLKGLFLFSKHVIPVMEAIAHEVVGHMEPGVNYLIGAGTTTRGVMELLGLPNALIGVDLVRDRRLVASDLSGDEILSHIQGRSTRLVATVTGGQGYLFGRGNQQLTPEVIRQIGKENILILDTKNKLAQLRGRPLLADTFDPELNRAVSGYYRVICAWGEFTVCRVSDQ